MCICGALSETEASALFKKLSYGSYKNSYIILMLAVTVNQETGRKQALYDASVSSPVNESLDSSQVIVTHIHKYDK